MGETSRPFATSSTSTSAPGFSMTATTRSQQVIDQVKAAGPDRQAPPVAFAGVDYSSIQAIARTGGYMPDDLSQSGLQDVAVEDITPRLGTTCWPSNRFVPEGPQGPQARGMASGPQAGRRPGERGVKMMMETGRRAREFGGLPGGGEPPELRVNFDPPLDPVRGGRIRVDALSLSSAASSRPYEGRHLVAKPRGCGAGSGAGQGVADIHRIVASGGPRASPPLSIGARPASNASPTSRGKPPAQVAAGLAEESTRGRGDRRTRRKKQTGAFLGTAPVFFRHSGFERPHPRGLTTFAASTRRRVPRRLIAPPRVSAAPCFRVGLHSWSAW